MTPDVPAPAGLKRLVFVAMPFGTKRDPRAGYDIDFDRIYEIGIKPAFARFPSLEYIRADEERGGGLIHLQMFERLLLAEIAIVDVTTENANVFYELGVRHAARPQTTIIIRGGEGALPFDINMMRAITYKLPAGVFSDAAGTELAAAVSARLDTALAATSVRDSPLFDLIPAYPGVTLPPGAAKTFLERERYFDSIRRRLAAARRKKADGLADLAAIEAEVGEVNETNADLVVDLVLSYRELATASAYDRLIALVERMPPALRERSIPLRQQYALALNRRNRDADRHRAIEELDRLCAQHGETSETCGMLGRVYKDCHAEAVAQQAKARAAGHLARAIEWYRRGFNADPRDYYPGVNLITLLMMDGSDEAREERRRTLPAVAFAVARQDAVNRTDYWTIATILELAVHANDMPRAEAALGRILALPSVPPFNLASTAAQLALVRRCEPRDVDLARLDALLAEIVAALPPPNAAAMVPLLSADAYRAYRSSQSRAVLAALDGELAAKLDSLAPGVVAALLAMSSETERAALRAQLAPSALEKLHAALDPAAYALLASAP